MTCTDGVIGTYDVAGVAVRHPAVVAAGRHYGATVHSCEPFDPESKGRVEATVRIAKADLVPTETNLRGAYASFADLVAACEEWCERGLVVMTWALVSNSTGLAEAALSIGCASGFLQADHPGGRVDLLAGDPPAGQGHHRTRADQRVCSSLAPYAAGRTVGL
jgi:hypothetical protein